MTLRWVLEATDMVREDNALRAAIVHAAKATIARLERAARDGYDVRAQLAEQTRRLAGAQ